MTIWARGTFVAEERREIEREEKLLATVASSEPQTRIGTFRDSRLCRGQPLLPAKKGFSLLSEVISRLGHSRKVVLGRDWLRAINLR